MWRRRRECNMRQAVPAGGYRERATPWEVRNPTPQDLPWSDEARGGTGLPWLREKPIEWEVLCARSKGRGAKWVSWMAKISTAMSSEITAIFSWDQWDMFHVPMRRPPWGEAPPRAAVSEAMARGNPRDMGTLHIRANTQAVSGSKIFHQGCACRQG